MTHTEDTNAQDQPQDGAPSPHKIDDRRGEVKPTDNPVPSSPEPDTDALREGEEKLGRVKPY